MFVCFPYRYQPEQPNLAYQMASTTDEAETNESVSTSESQTAFLPGEGEKLSLKVLLVPQNTIPSKLSGFIVNVSTCVIGKQLFPKTSSILNRCGS